MTSGVGFGGVSDTPYGDPATVTGATEVTTMKVTSTTQLGDAAADTVTVYGNLATSGDPTFDYSGGSGTFKTSTGINTFGGDVAIASGKDFGMAGASTFGTGTGAVSLNGDVSVASGKNLTMAGTGTFTTGSGAVGLAGNVTISGTKTLTTGTGLTTCGGDLQVSGNDIHDSGAAAAITMDGSQNVAITGDLTVTGNDIKSSGGNTCITLSGANVTCPGNLTVTGTHTFTAGTITGDLDIAGTDLQATTGTLNISKSGSMTTVKGTLNVDEAVTLDTTLGVTGAASFGANVTLGDNKADDIKFSGDVIGDSVTNADFILSASSGAFAMPTGTCTHGGSSVFTGTTDIQGNVTATTGNPSFDLSASNAAWTMPTGTCTFGGSNVTTGTLDVQGNVTASTGNPSFDLSSSNAAFTTSTGTFTHKGAMVAESTIDVQGNIGSSTGNPNCDLSGSSGTFLTPTGAGTFGNSTNTFSNNIVLDTTSADRTITNNGTNDLIISTTTTGDLLLTTAANLYIGDGNTKTNYTAISATGTMTFAGSARPTKKTWLPPAAFLSHTGSAVSGAVNEGSATAYAFDKGGAEDISTTWLLPDNLDASADIVCYVYWSGIAKVVNDVVWDLDYVALAAGESVGGAATNVTVTDTVGGTADFLMKTGALTIANANITAGDMLVLRVRREGADGADNLDEDAEFYGLELNWRSSGA